MKDKLTIKDTDTLTIYVKKNRSKEIIENYQLFGWRVDSQQESVRYADILDITFSRPHKLKHKDELQLYQVYMEERMIALAKLERNQRSKTAVVGLCLGVLGVVLFVLGILSCVKMLKMFTILPSLLMTVLGIGVLMLGGIFLPNILKKEKSIYEIKNTEINNEIKNIKNKVLSLNEGKNSEK